MNKFYETVVKYDRIGESGNIEKVTEQILLTAESCTDAEATVIKSIESFIKGECDVMSVKQSKYSEYITDEDFVDQQGGDILHSTYKNDNAKIEADKYFAVKVSYIEIAENSKKKKIPNHYMIRATSTDAAFKLTELFLQDYIVDYEVNSIVETKIVDVVLKDSLTK